MGAERRCLTNLGRFGDAPCVRDGVAAYCLIDHGLDAGATQVLYAGGAVPHLCRVAGGRFGTAYGADMLAIAPSPAKYSVTLPDGFYMTAPWHAAFDDDLTNVAFYRGPAAADGILPGLSMQRRTAASDATLDALEDELERSVAEGQNTTVVGTRRFDLGGTPAAIVDARVEDPFKIRMELGGLPALRTAATYTVLNAVLLFEGDVWMVTCSTTAPAPRRGPPMCDSIVSSLRFRPAS